ncbi:phage tail protein I [Chromobacterium sp. IIBBL 290-4]|uniref:phage tail protein I n=1 Tax=Chromobacterium sp. IIBBL 290-4 TaxID=2953890 RepID=UPI0020B8C8A2|nr:phage tail protein I [Chromobacterium sp. IIBBL 290-4]UTH73342.1 phage tail protein I [Chromobacterium sp. IIBBL 290-4]
MSAHLLPPNRTPLEAALADACELALDPSPIRGLADSARCPAALLPWLAWSRSVENLDAAATEEQQRALIASSVAVHRRKGTPAAVRQVFRDLDLGEVRISEGNHRWLADGSMTADGFPTAGDPMGWPEYRVQIDKVLSLEQAAAARKILNDVAPARSVLWGLDFTGATLIANGYASANGAYTAGVIRT